MDKDNTRLTRDLCLGIQRLYGASETQKALVNLYDLPPLSKVTETYARELDYLVGISRALLMSLPNDAAE